MTHLTAGHSGRRLRATAWRPLLPPLPAPRLAVPQSQRPRTPSASATGAGLSGVGGWVGEGYTQEATRVGASKRLQLGTSGRVAAEPRHKCRRSSTTALAALPAAVATKQQYNSSAAVQLYLGVLKAKPLGDVEPLIDAAKRRAHCLAVPLQQSGSGPDGWIRSTELDKVNSLAVPLQQAGKDGWIRSTAWRSPIATCKQERGFGKASSGQATCPAWLFGLCCCQTLQQAPAQPPDHAPPQGCRGSCAAWRRWRAQTAVPPSLQAASAVGWS